MAYHSASVRHRSVSCRPQRRVLTTQGPHAQAPPGKMHASYQESPPLPLSQWGPIAWEPRFSPHSPSQTPLLLHKMTVPFVCWTSLWLLLVPSCGFLLFLNKAIFADKITAVYFLDQAVEQKMHYEHTTFCLPFYLFRCLRNPPQTRKVDFTIWVNTQEENECSCECALDSTFLFIWRLSRRFLLVPFGPSACWGVKARAAGKGIENMGGKTVCVSPCSCCLATPHISI